MSSRRPASSLALVGPLLLLTALAFGHAGVQPLWEDETYGLLFAQRSLPALLQALAASEPHLPPYFLLLRAWEALAGPTAFAERWPSAAFLILTSLVVYRMARLLAGPGAGWPALGFWAIQPEGFWYGQEVRMYAPLIFWAALAVLLLLRALQSGRRRDWLLCSLAELAALWTHYAGALVVLVAAALVLGFARPGQRLRDCCWLAWPALTYLPWLWYVRHIRPPTARPTGTLATQVLDVGRGLLLGYGGPLLPAPLTVVLIVLLGAVLAAALAVTVATVATEQGVGNSTAPPLLGRRRVLQEQGVGNSAASPLLGRRRALQIAAVPVAVILLVPLVVPPLHFLFNARYLCLVCPSLCVLWAVAIRILATRARLAAAALAVLLAGASVAGMAVVLAPGFRHWYAYPPAMAYVRQHEQPGQVLIDNSGVDPTARYYYQQVDQGHLPVLLLPPYHPGSVPDVEHTALGLNQRSTGVWLPLDAAKSWDGDRVAERALDATLIPTDQWRFQDVTLRFYLTAKGLAASHPADITFGGAIRLVGYGVRRSGNQWLVSFHWQALHPPGRNYTVFVHAVDASGHLLSQGDAPPDDGRQPTGAWSAGADIYDLHRVPIPAHAATARLDIGWYDPTTNQRLAITTGGDSADLGQLPAGG